MEPQDLDDHLGPLAKFLAEHDPDPTAPDDRRTLDWLAETCTWLLDHVTEIEPLCETAETASQVRGHVIDRCAAGAATLETAKRGRVATGLLERCAALSEDAELRAFYQAGVTAPTAFAKVVRASWLLAHDRRDEARELAATLTSEAAPIAELAKRIQQAPEPISSAPGAGTLNGFGVRFYGRSNVDEDGRYTMFRFVTALYIPVLPLDAYRASDDGDGHRIYGKVGLSPVMRAWKYGALILAALAITWAIASSILDSPERKLRLAVDEVAELESEDPEAALRRYEELALEYIELESDVDLLPVTEGWVRVAASTVPAPVDSSMPGSAIVERYMALPMRLQRGVLVEPLVGQLIAWSKQPGTDTQDTLDATFDYLSLAESFDAPRLRNEVEAGLGEARLVLAQRLEGDWPLEALRQYAQLVDQDPEIAAQMTRLIDDLPASPTLFVEIAPALSTWSTRVTGPSSERAVELASEGQQRANDPARAELLAALEREPLEAALEADPSDQPVIGALAEIDRLDGKLDEAAARIESLGKPGLLIPNLQLQYASLQHERGQAEDAALLLAQILRSRMPAFEDARRAYDRKIVALQDQLIAQAEQGNIPARHRSALTGNDEDKAREAFQAWLSEEIESSQSLRALQDRYMRQSDIVGVGLLLGRIQLERAQTETGEARQQLLDEAETVFLSIRSEAGGLPAYQVGLGQVYYRLGRVEEGRAEFQQLLDGPDLSSHLLVASGYRDLGRFEEAREITEAVYTQASSAGPEELAHSAAVHASLLAEDLDDKRMWLERADQSDEFVKTNLLEVEGDELMRAGEFAAADDKYAQAYELYAARAEREGSSSNNAALALMSRYQCTGDDAHVERAVELMRESVALHPDTGIIVGNYASILGFQARLELIDRFVPIKNLRIGTHESTTLLQALVVSDRRDEVLAAVQASAARKQVLDTWAQVETLSPQQAVSYMMRAYWHGLTYDAAALTKLAERLRQVEGLDTSAWAKSYADHLDGSSDENSRRELDAGLAHRAATREASPRSPRPAQAALAYLDGETYQERWVLQPDASAALTDARAAVEAYERAQQLWPALSSHRLADALIAVAMLELAVDDAELYARWTADLRRQGTSLTLHEMSSTGSVPAGLAEHPAFTRSLELRRAAPDYTLSPLDVAVAEIADDDALLTRALAWLDSEPSQAGFEFAALTSPYDDRTERTRAWLRSASTP